jgi:hypothetical protein
VRRPRTGTLLGFLLFLLPATLLGDAPELFPDLSVHLKAIRYVPADADFQWSGWIGAGAGLVRLGRATLSGTADVETIIGNQKRAFDANQANYHLAFGVRIRVGEHTLYPVFNHVSRHLVDRAKTPAVDWNLIGARFEGPLPRSLGVPGAFELGVAKAILRSYVDYDWEFLAAAHGAVVRWSGGELFVEADARAVTTTNRVPYFRNGFLDFTGAAGVRIPREGRTLDFFVAYEHRNDVFVLVPGARDRALLAIRIGLGRWRDLTANP